MPLYPARALERAMKIKEVITRAISGKINWIQAAEILGCRIGSCAGGESGGTNTATTDYSIVGRSNRVRSEYQWPTSRPC